MNRPTLGTLFASIAAVLAIPISASAQTAASDFLNFQPIVSLPLVGQGGTLGATTSLCDYLNAIFEIAIATAIVLAVIMIAFDGFKYMTSEAVGNKKDALAGIRSALFGLVLLLAIPLLLGIINPNITTLSVFSPNGGVLGNCTR